MITLEKIAEYNSECELNKAKWPTGPWTNEPNRVEWEHAGMTCLALRHPQMGHWCGYVGLRPGHKYYGIPESYRDLEDEEGERVTEAVCAYNLSHGHGGVTYGRFCEGIVCHIVDNEDERLYWLGFDCAHAGDLSPSRDNMMGFDDTYKDIEYVKSEVNKMAEELAELS